MRKVAVFVEGRTEQELLRRLLEHSADTRKLHIEVRRQYGGAVQLSVTAAGGWDLLVLLVNCCGDEQVKTQIIESYSHLEAQGYSLIVGLRDVYPATPELKERVAARVAAGLPIGKTPIRMLLAVMEVEAWFLAEHSHFPRIHADLTIARIEQSGLWNSAESVEDVTHPAALLNSIYRLVGFAYAKDRRRVERTLDSLDIQRLRTESASRSESLSRLVAAVDEILA